MRNCDPKTKISQFYQNHTYIHTKMASKPFDDIDLDSLNLLNEMEIISTSLKKSSMEDAGKEQPLQIQADLNDFLQGSNFSDADDVSGIPSLTNDPIQITRLKAISNTFSENFQKQARFSSRVSTDDGCYESAQEDGFGDNNNDEFINSRISSSVIQRIILSDGNDNSRHLSQEYLHEDDEGSNTIIMAAETSSGSEFNSSFSVDNKTNDKRVSSNSSQGSTNKFKTNRIISPSQVYTLSPSMPLAEGVSNYGNRKSILKQVLDSLSPVSTYSSVFDNGIDDQLSYTARNETYPQQRNVSQENLIKSRQILQNIQRRVTSDVLLPKEEESKRVVSTSSLKNELDKIWESVVGNDLVPTDTSFPKELGVDANSKSLWTPEEAEETSLDNSFSNGKSVIDRALKLEDEYELPVQRSSTGLGIYHNNTDQVESEKKISKGNILDLLNRNGVTLVDNSLVYQAMNEKEKEDYVQHCEVDMPSTPQKKMCPNSGMYSKNKIPSPVKVIEPKQKAPVEKEASSKPSPLAETEVTSKNRRLKLKDATIKDLGYLYISLDTLSLSTFALKSNSTLSFKDKNCKIQILFDNCHKIIESEWVSLNELNSKLTSFIDLSSQEFATEIPTKDVLKNRDDTIFEIQITLKMKYDHPKSKIIEIQDRVPVSSSSATSYGNSQEADRSNSLTKIFKKGSKHKNSPKLRNVEYQTVTKKITQQIPDPWSSNFAPDNTTFATISLPITLHFIEGTSHKVTMETAVVKSVLGDCKQIGLLSFKALRLENTATVLPKSISAIEAILDRREKVKNKIFSGVMYQQGLDLGEMVKRRHFELRDGTLVGSTGGDDKVIVNLENVSSVLIDCECPLPGYNFELLFEGNTGERLLLSCDSIKERRKWLHRISELLEIITVVKELYI